MTRNRLFNQWRRLISHLVQISLKLTLEFLSLAIEYKSRAQCYSLSHFEINRILWSLESKLLLLYIDNCLPYWCMSRSMHKNVDMKTNYWTSGYFKLQWRTVTSQFSMEIITSRSLIAFTKSIDWNQHCSKRKPSR